MLNNTFYFTIIDDTDDATLKNIKPIYDFLFEHKIYITKTVWVYPPRDTQSKGDSLQRPDYLHFIKDIKEKGFEIGLHHVGSGNYNRDEILKGIEDFKILLGEYPKIHINHAYNPDSIYGGNKRFNWPFNWFIKKLYPQYAGIFQGETTGSKYFWGDKHKEIIEFSRNHEFDGMNTAKFDKFMPYTDPKRSDYANFWFSATFSPNQRVFNHLVTKKSIDQLEKEKGICILFTHLGYFMHNGEIDPGFVESIKYISKKRNGVFIPVSQLMYKIMKQRIEEGKEPNPMLPIFSKFRMEFQHLLTRLKYRKFIKIDDYSFKNLDKEMFISTN